MREKGETHAVMLPWLAFGHMIPFLELAIALANEGIKISFISTPRNIQRFPKIPQNLSKFINFISLPIPQLESNPLPENAEATVDVPIDKVDSLKIACDLLQQPIKNTIAQVSPNWLIVDFFHHWVADISQDLNIPLIFYTMFTASTNVFTGSPEFLTGEGRKKFRPSPESMTAPPHWVDFPSKVAYTIHEAKFAHSGFYGANGSGISDNNRIARMIEASRAVAIRSCPEFEASYLELFSKITGKPVFPVGLLQPDKPSTHCVEEQPWNKVFHWLDSQKPMSVVYVGFGSEIKLRKEEIHEIACGIELSGHPFLWVMRKGDKAGNDLDALPPGFCTRTAGRGLVLVGWAPQREILAHPAIGGLLFHAGWGSIIEALQFGHVLVCLPLVFDQPLVARLLEERQLGIEVKKAEDGSFSRDGIMTAIGEAMGSNQLRARARVAADKIFGNRDLQRSYVKKFADYLKSS